MHDQPSLHARSMLRHCYSMGIACLKVAKQRRSDYHQVEVLEAAVVFLRSCLEFVTQDTDQGMYDEVQRQLDEALQLLNATAA